MRLILQSEDSESNRRLSDELMKIEQYVDMALCYVRLESSGNDLVIKHFSLDDIVKKNRFVNSPRSLSGRAEP